MIQAQARYECEARNAKRKTQNANLNPIIDGDVTASTRFEAHVCTLTPAVCFLAARYCHDASGFRGHSRSVNAHSTRSPKRRDKCKGAQAAIDALSVVSHLHPAVGHHAYLRETVQAFTNALLMTEPAIPGLDRSVIIPARRLHLTLGVMSLDAEPTSRTLDGALALLHQVRPQVMQMLKGQKLRVAFRNIDIMKPERGDLERAHVMWVGPSPEDNSAGLLKSVAEFIQRTFQDAGYVLDNRPLKPRGKIRQPFSYASVLNSSALRSIAIERSETANVVEPQAPTRGPMRVNLGEWDVEDIQICEMGSWGPEGEYVGLKLKLERPLKSPPAIIARVGYLELRQTLQRAGSVFVLVALFPKDQDEWTFCVCFYVDS
ncbi:hypothetical protein POSPLADRAFT_1067877 [Postia placenta MAD-698-R-SB12]|uniref:A-kinase anchor protein 7-like phosphoesterase domain-containing protein n=1 Tax=Postia placenta MAD-698-R-SB12 TaxID=670580 RepID=A0A1X6ML21_9APHY|nr:hypothetical protein POSPLADRAFT_1067877 [Postia placenta MAD-698-R-SB12]OSX57080.1 hypothetical protein POSPLADRAFT_1067877 [Postia placenta MAD-698-R-SB12]